MSIKKCTQCLALLAASGCLVAIPAFAQSSGSAHAKTTFNQSTIRSVQQELKTSGYYHGKIDGVVGPNTKSAIRAYQKDQNLAVTGRLNSGTVMKLRGQSAMQNMNEAARAANNQSTNNASANPSKATIESAQRQLKGKGLYSGAINGKLDQSTESAIRNYQQQNNLTVNGKLDNDTLNKLGVSTTNQQPQGMKQ